MPEFFKRLFGFEHLIASFLIKLIYWIGLVGIVLGSFGMMVYGMSQMGYEFALGFLIFLGAPVGGAIALVVWRFSMEMTYIQIGIYNRLGEIRDRTPNA